MLRGDNMKINIVLPYSDAEKYVYLWANEEEQFDFDKEKERATRCTLSFGATELLKYLKMLNFSVCVFETKKENHINVFLSCKNEEYSDCTFSFLPCNDGFLIEGNSRTGVLYGCYEFLKMQGIRWYAPGKEYEFVPQNVDFLKIPKEKQKFSPDMSLGRGFDFEGVLKESVDFWLWMARNKMNMASYRKNTDPFMRKLGMTYKVGGHIFEKMLNPDNIAENGKTFWEEHNAWYGMPEKEEKRKETALSIQFCVTNEELIDYLSNKLIHTLNTTWKNASRVDVWGFDTWGKTCNCEKCKKLGNGTDKTLYFMGKLREKINKSDFKRNIELVMCAYEGTATLQLPENEIPEILKKNGDLIVFYPITRCYRHNINDKSCEINNKFFVLLEKWLQKKNVPDIIIGEYYNVSKLEDLPLVFTKRIENDLKYYVDLGIKGITYMHVPLINHSVRAVNHLLYAELSWNKNANVKAILNEYFQNMYGEHSEKMIDVYELLEESWQDCQNIRSWGDNSVLSQLLNEKSDREELVFENHFKNEEDFVKTCEKNVVKLNKALKIANEVYKNVKENIEPTYTNVRPVNPEQGKVLLPPEDFYRISEDIRFIRYGLDVMEFTKNIVDYHNKNLKSENTDVLWNEIENLYDKLNSYYMPLGFNTNIAEIYCKDALTRTQLRTVVDRYRKNRYKGKDN